MYIYGFLFLLCVFMDDVYKMYLHVFNHDFLYVWARCQSNM
jgi:hypothetical protein